MSQLQAHCFCAEPASTTYDPAGSRHRGMSQNVDPVQSASRHDKSEDPWRSPVRDRQLILVSNRQPYRHTTADGGETRVIDRPTGGVTSALDPVMQRIGGTWIAWGDGERDSEVVDSAGRLPVPPDDPRYVLKRIWLTERLIDGYYYGFSNQVLWPTCHSALTKILCEESFWTRYQQVNDRFATAVAEHAERGAVIWFQDYHLALAPRKIREWLPKDTVVLHFWHIPWPAWDTFRSCPHGREVVKGLLGNDVLVFHSPRYQSNFLGCVDAMFREATIDWQTGRVYYRDDVTTIDAIPMGVPVDRIEDELNSSRAESGRDPGFSDSQRLAIGVDRLDYTKGLLERLRALERVWESPGLRGEFTYLQIATKSRSRIPDYRELQRRVSDEIARINQRFGTTEWQPIHFQTDHVPRKQLFALYSRADLALVSPIRDGMNLVAQEFAVAQTDEPGVLVLSDQAGIHDAIGTYTLTVRPADIEGFADTIREALTMELGERRERMNGIRRWCASHDLDAWLKKNLRAAHVRHLDPGSVVS